MQVDPIKPALKAHGTKRLKLKCDKLLSSFTFKFNLRRYNVGIRNQKPRHHEFVATLFGIQMCASITIVVTWIIKTYAHGVPDACAAGAYTRSRKSST